MPRNKKEELIFGIFICLIMVFFMGLLNISVHLGGFDLNTLKTAVLAFPLTFIIAFVLENLVIGKINHKLISIFVKDTDSVNSYILFNCFFIVTFMSMIMTIIGGLLGGDNLTTVFNNFFINWPRNFCAAFFLNILVAGPVSRFILRTIQSKTKLNAFATDNQD